MSLRKFVNKPFDLETGLFLFTLLAYILYSIIMISIRVPYFDEINAWNISANCNFLELLQVSRHEGHFILWYLLIKPFAANNILFPQSMFAVNWIFAFLSVIILWIRAPFNPWFKMLITFSLPIQMFSIYARCYAIGVFFLFVICSIYSKRKEHPVIYSSLILLLANTSIMGMVTAFVLGIIYFVELVVDKRNNLVETKTLLQPFFIFIFCAFLIIIQMVCFSVPTYSLNPYYMSKVFFDFFHIDGHIPSDIVIIVQAFLILTGIKFFKRDYCPYIFLLLSTAIVIDIGLYLYVLSCWHYMFLFIFLVSAMWIYMDRYNLDTKFQKIYYLLFGLVSFCAIFFFRYPWHWNGFHLPTKYYIEGNMNIYKNSKIFLFPTDSTVLGIVPTFKNSGMYFYCALGTSYNSAQTYVNQWGRKRIDFEGIKQGMLSENKTDKNFMFVSRQDNSEFLNALKENSTGLNFEYYGESKDIIIYKINY